MTINPNAPAGKSHKYSIPERERRFLLHNLPANQPIVRTVRITDSYFLGTRLRLRQMVEAGDGPNNVISS